MPSQPLSEKQALSRVAALCARGEHCRRDILEKLRRWGVGEESQERIIDYLVEHQYIDEARFSQAFVRDKTTYNRWGRRKVEQALRAKGIPDDVISEALTQVEDTDYAEKLRPLLDAKRRTIRAGSDYERNMKLIRFALQRGFTMDVIRQCMSDLADTDYME